MIETIVQKIKAQDPEILKKKPAFNVKEERFEELKKEEDRKENKRKLLGFLKEKY